MHIHLDIDDVIQVSQDSLDRIAILINFDFLTSKGERIMKDTILEVRLPRMLVDEEDFIDSTMAVAKSSILTAFISNFAISAIFNLSLSMLWSIINALQLIIFMPLFALKYPANATSFNEPITQIATFDRLDHYGLQ